MDAERARIEYMPLSEIKRAPKNPKGHDLGAIHQMIGKYGYVDSMILDERTGQLVSGHGRLDTLEQLKRSGDAPPARIEVRDGEWYVPVTRGIRFESDEQAQAYLIGANRSVELGGWDENALVEILKSLDGVGMLDATGFSQSDIDDIVKTILMDATQDETPPVPEKATTQRGDVFELGAHRLMCGDAGEVGDIKSLLGVNDIHLVITDPPWNVSIEPSAGMSGVSEGGKLISGRAARKGVSKSTKASARAMVGDTTDPEEYKKLLHTWFTNIAWVLVPGRAFYVWGGYVNATNYIPAFKECMLYFSQAIAWIKEWPVLTRKDYMGNFELCFYGWREGAAHFFVPDVHNAIDTWTVKKINPSNMVHLTEKPVELAVKAMTYSSRPGENVLDIFGGSGSTLIAAEQMDRKAFVMEIDERYCDVILQRYENFTGKEPKKTS